MKSNCWIIILTIIVHVAPGLARRSNLAEKKKIIAWRRAAKANNLENQSEGARNLACMRLYPKPD